MNCPRCTGRDGAHYAFCFIAEVWERLMGDRFPWMAPRPAPSDVLCMHGIDLSDPCDDCAKQPPWESGLDPDEFLFGAGPTLDGEWERLDPPDPEGVAADTAVAAGAPSDADWMPDREERLHAAMKTDLPDGYLDGKLKRQANLVPGYSEALRARREADKRAREDAVVQFLYDETETVTGSRVRATDAYERYGEWAANHDRPGMGLSMFRSLVKQLGYEEEKSYSPGTPQIGAPPVQVKGLRLKGGVDQSPPVTFAEPDVVITPTPEKQASDRPGTELAKEVRDLVRPLIADGWRYHKPAKGRARPRVTNPNGKTVMLDAKPHGGGLTHVKAALKRAGAKL